VTALFPEASPGNVEPKLRALHLIQRELAAKAITRDGTIVPDILCLQRLRALSCLGERHPDSAYRYALLVDSRDFRQIDVGIGGRAPSFTLAWRTTAKTSVRVGVLADRQKQSDFSPRLCAGLS
jgi:hypothetical protein